MTSTDTEKDDKDGNREDDTSMDVQADQEALDSQNGLQAAAKFEPMSVSDNVEVEPEYMSGFKLLLATGIVALISFTMLLDTSIVVTVSCIQASRWLMLILAGNSPHHE